MEKIWKLLLIFRRYMCRGCRATSSEYLHNRGCTLHNLFLAILGAIGDFMGKIGDICQLLLIFC